MRVAAIHMNSGADVGDNLRLADRLIGDAVNDGCTMAVLPENFALMPVRGRDKAKAAEEPGDGPIQAFLSDLSERHGIWIIAGSMPLTSPEIKAERVYGACPVYDAKGNTRAIYRKIHLFDVDLTESGGGVFKESTFIAPGEDVVVASMDFGKIGLSVCYDVRFPELYREMAARGAHWIAVPSAFAPQTGKDHWEVLLRARAIENQAFVLAPAQCGRHSQDRASYGCSLIIDPWGAVLARAADEPAVILADCDRAAVDRVRASLPALRHRRL